jgi:hypothetical protein
MALVMPHVGELQFLKLLLNINGNKLKLFSNNVTVVGSTVLGDLTEMSGGGYAAITLVAGSWTFNSGTPSRAIYNAFQSFTFSGAPAVATCYGYYVVDAAGPNLLYAENITAVTGINATTVIPILPQITLKSVQQ